MSYGLFLDLVIIVLLGATIFYAMRLTRYLEQFRSNRADMERLIRDLSMQITRAQEGIGTLDNLAKESSDELRTLLNKGRSLSDELQLITEAGDSLATRLEQLSVRARAGTMAGEDLYESQYESPAREAPVFAAPSRSAPSSASLFAIRDPDFEHDDDGTDDNLGSQAEKDLARALRKRNK